NAGRHVVGIERVVHRQGASRRNGPRALVPPQLIAAYRARSRDALENEIDGRALRAVVVDIADIHDADGGVPGVRANQDAESQQVEAGSDSIVVILAPGMIAGRLTERSGREVAEVQRGECVLV